LDGLQEAVDLIFLTDLDMLEPVDSIDVNLTPGVTREYNWRLS